MPKEHLPHPAVHGSNSTERRSLVAPSKEDEKNHESRRLADEFRHLLRLLNGHQARLAQSTSRPRPRAPDRPAPLAQYALTAQNQQREALTQQRQYRRFCTLCIVALTQSTATLREIVDFASDLLLLPALELIPRLLSPDGTFQDPFWTLKQRTILTLDRIALSLPQGLNLRLVFATVTPNPLIDQGLVHNGISDGPKCWVPAKPWTDVTDSDEAVSELVSTFLTWMNPFWRLVEEDLFLQAMRARVGTVDYCSPLLVNCMLALASQYSEIDGAFYTPGDLLTRGEHFHQEAMRLLELERGTISVTAVQARLLLSFDAILRGKDLSTSELTMQAATINKLLPLPSIVEEGLSSYAKARKCLDASVSFFVLSLHLAWLLPLDDAAHNTRISLNLSGLPDRTVYWTSYPAPCSPKPYRPTLLLRERAHLTQLSYKATELLVSEEKRDPIDFRKALESLTSKAESWLDDLPDIMQATPDMSAPVLQLHAQYHAIMLGVYTRGLDIFERLGRRVLAKAIIGMVSCELRQRIMQHIHRTETLVRWCRESYGFSFASPSLFHAVTTALMAALPQLPSETSETAGSRNLGLDSAVEECFRFLLACGMQQQFPRGLARMVYLSTKQLKVSLPDNVSRMIEIVLDAAWQRSLVLNNDSLYPNIAITISQEDSEEGKQHTLRMGELIRKCEEML